MSVPTLHFVPADGAGARPGQGIAQHNIRQRLQLAYHAPNPLEIAETPEHYRIAFTIPLQEGDPEELAEPRSTIA